MIGERNFGQSPAGAAGFRRRDCHRVLSADHAGHRAGLGAAGPCARSRQRQIYVHRRRLRRVSRGAGQGMRRSQHQGPRLLVGGRCLKTPFGTFHVPNISPDKDTGIGNWTTLDFVNAMKRGVAPDGSYLYPAFPYTSYQRMTYEDLIDLKAYLDSLPAVKSDVPPHELKFPFNLRRGLGLWHQLYVDGESFVPDANASAELNRGAYLVRGAGHCTECHSARNLLGGIDARHRIRRRGRPRGRRHGAQHHPERGRHRRLEPGGHRLSARNRKHARLRRDRREHGAGAGKHGQAHAGGPQRHRRLYQVAAAAARRRAQGEKRARGPRPIRLTRPAFAPAAK